MISSSLEEYLKTMYILKKQNGKIRVTDVADKMNCTKASVNKAVNNLKANELLSYETYGSIELTDKGENIAKKVLEAYDIGYLFFKDVLNLDEEKADVEAKNIKGAISDEALNNLAKYVYKTLGLNTMNCDYDINKEQCRCCIKKNPIKK